MRAAVEQYRGLAQDMGAKYNVNPLLLLAIMERESQGNPRAKGGVGEIGLMQLWPKGAIAAYEGAMKEKGISTAGLDYWDPKTNVMVAAWFLGVHIPWQLKKYKAEDSLINRVMAYNGGVGAVLRGPKPITVDYVEAVMRFMRAESGPASTVTGASSGASSSWVTRLAAVGGVGGLLLVLWRLIQKH